VSLVRTIVIALAAGVGAGLFLHANFPASVSSIDHYVLAPVGTAFLRLVQFAVVPILFGSLVMGLHSLWSTNRVRIYIQRLLLLYVITSSLAFSIAIGLALLIQPGAAVMMRPSSQVRAVPKAPLEWVTTILPANPLAALGSENILQVIITALLLGTAMQLIGQRARPLLTLIEAVYATGVKLLDFILLTVPVGVFALVASAVAAEGFQIVARLATYVMGVIVAICLMTAIYSVLMLVAGIQPLRFFRAFSPALSFAFATASSAAALPLVLRNAINYGMKEEIAHSAIPFGMAVKRDGAGIGQAFSAIFVAQLFDVSLTSSVIVTVFAVTFLVSYSTAGVPGAGIIAVTTVLSASGLPLEGVAMVAGVDRLLDSFRTTLNVIGITVNAALLEKWAALDLVDGMSVLADSPATNLTDD
jgi:Na+/H+-dicarboxylate symporter